ncbi:BON domain-containing protein [Clavibacter sp. B3I6]|uniref:BON domain-containing protein n=1 Tax=Clavibacter sp. B3I6 TaxID=3042268 RepID=UPI00358FFB98
MSARSAGGDGTSGTARSRPAEGHSPQGCISVDAASHQDAAARRAVARLTGVAAVIDDITLSQRPASRETSARIRAALIRDATVEAARVHATTAGTTVTLTGRVRSHDERQQAESLGSPHVDRVVDDIAVWL